MRAECEFHREPGVGIGEPVAEQLLELVDPVPDGLRVHVEARGELVVGTARLQPGHESGGHAVTLLGGEVGEGSVEVLAQLVGEKWIGEQ